MAFVRSAQRSYDRAALEEWFENFDFSWESKFSSRELKEGRKLYTGGAVHTLELRKNYASANLKFADGTMRYCVIDFDRGSFTLRGSSGDDFTDSVCAVAGLYEVEELMADELPPLKFVAPPQKNIEIGDSEEKSALQSGRSEEAEERAMKLSLVFRLKRDSLIFASYWKTDSGLKPAFGDSAIRADALNKKEREKLVRLASFARKAGFSYDGKNHVLSDASSFPRAASNAITHWRKYFDVPKNADLELVLKGVRNLSLDISLSSSGLGNFSADFSASLDGEKIGFDELKILDGLDGRCAVLPKRGLVRLSQKDESLISSARQAFGLFKGKPPRYMLFTLFDDSAVKLSRELEDWKKSVSASAELPENLKFLRNYQREGVSKILSVFSSGCSMLLADEMGLGKTVQSLAAISTMHDLSKNFLIVCPASVIPVWRSEIEKFFPHLKSKTLDSDADFSKESGIIWLASYTQLRRNRQKLENAEFEMAVLDEAQYIKNPDSKISATCMSIKSRKRLALTGTPIENRLTDLWTIFRWLMPGLMGTRAQFERRISEDANFAERLKRQIAPFVLRRMKSDVAKELPPKFFVDLPCPMSEVQKTEYLRLLSDARSALKSSDRRERISVLSLLTRLRQASCDPALLPNLQGSDFSNSGKISALCSALSTVFSSGKKAVVFSQFVKFLERIKEKVSIDFPEAEIFELTGSSLDRKAPVDAFQNAKKPAVIFVSLRAGGTGITLTGADYVFIADPWWNPAVEEQAIDRVHRIGKSGDVMVYRLVSEGTVEENVRRLQLKKKAVFEEVIGSLSKNKKSFEEAVSEILDDFKD